MLGFAAISAATVVPLRAAIADSVSPLATVYLLLLDKEDRTELERFDAVLETRSENVVPAVLVPPEAVYSSFDRVEKLSPDPPRPPPSHMSAKLSNPNRPIIILPFLSRRDGHGHAVLHNLLLLLECGWSPAAGRLFRQPTRCSIQMNTAPMEGSILLAAFYKPSLRNLLGRSLGPVGLKSSCSAIAL